MKKYFVLLSIALYFSISASAQSTGDTANHLTMQTIFRLDGSFEQWNNDGPLTRTVSPSNSELYTILDGNLTDRITLFGSFHWLNSDPASLYRNSFRADSGNWVDILTLTYTFDNRMYLTAGKDFMAVGGFEQDPSSSMVYYDLASNNWNLMQVYQYGGRIGFTAGDDDSLQDCFVQIIGSPFSGRVWEDGLMTATLGWNGTAGSGWKTMYSATMIQTGGDKDIFMISLGNKWTSGPFAFTLDAMTRSYGLQDHFNQEFTSVTDIRWSFPKLDIFFKGGWEFCHNDENMFASNDTDASWNISGSIVADHIYKDRDYAFGGLGLEYFPLKDRNLRLTLFGATNNYCNGGGAIVASIRYSLESLLY